MFSKAKRALGIDIGMYAVKAVQLSKAGVKYRVEAASVARVDRNQMNVDPTAAQAAAVRECLRTIDTSQSIVVGALPGQTVVIRYPRLPEMPEEKIADAIEKEVGQYIPYDLAEVFLDWTLLDTVAQGDEKLMKVLLVAAKHEVIDTRMLIAEHAEVKFSVLGVDSLALADAAEACELFHMNETVALINIGQTSASIHFVRDGVSSFIRDIAWGARELIQAIIRARHLDYEQAEKLLHASVLGREKEVQSPVPDAALGPFVEEPSPKSSAASLLEPLEDELEGAGRASLSKPSVAREGEPEKDLHDIVSIPLGRLVSEIRRSFDYYEHELYESSVDRLILSGGISHLPFVRETLAEELGVKIVEVANPLDSAVLLGNAAAVASMKEQPAQFMVALGLAARGTVDL